jgi:hypothetical protein
VRFEAGSDAGVEVGMAVKNEKNIRGRYEYCTQGLKGSHGIEAWVVSHDSESSRKGSKQIIA